MTQASRIIVADAGPLIALAKCEQLSLLPLLFEAVHVPQQVLLEVSAPRKPRAQHLAEFVAQHAVVEPDRQHELLEKLAKSLDIGEAQAICCAKDLGCMVLIDEKKGRLIAQAYGVPLIGVLGVFILAKRQGYIAAIKPLIHQLQQHNYLLGDDLISQILRAVGEQAEHEPAESLKQ
jgi:uncharacterized protein